MKLLLLLQRMITRGHMPSNLSNCVTYGILALWLVYNHVPVHSHMSSLWITAPFINMGPRRPLRCKKIYLTVDCWWDLLSPTTGWIRLLQPIPLSYLSTTGRVTACLLLCVSFLTHILARGACRRLGLNGHAPSHGNCLIIDSFKFIAWTGSRKAACHSVSQAARNIYTEGCAPMSSVRW